MGAGLLAVGAVAVVSSVIASKKGQDPAITEKKKSLCDAFQFAGCKDSQVHYMDYNSLDLSRCHY